MCGGHNWHESRAQKKRGRELEEMGKSEDHWVTREEAGAQRGAEAHGVALGPRQSWGRPGQPGPGARAVSSMRCRGLSGVTPRPRPSQSLLCP